MAKANKPIEGVKCSVNSCYYWHQGNQCMAGQIEVQPPHATNVQETDCATFHPQN